jgi:Bacteriocin-protection, YdeI or OmpD-Associated
MWLRDTGAAFFDTLAQFYRQAYLRWIDATARRPDLRAARIGEVVDLLAACPSRRSCTTT